MTLRVINGGRHDAPAPRKRPYRKSLKFRIVNIVAGKDVDVSARPK